MQAFDFKVHCLEKRLTELQNQLSHLLASLRETVVYSESAGVVGEGPPASPPIRHPTLSSVDPSASSCRTSNDQHTLVAEDGETDASNSPALNTILMDASAKIKENGFKINNLNTNIATSVAIVEMLRRKCVEQGARQRLRRASSSPAVHSYGLGASALGTGRIYPHDDLQANHLFKQIKDAEQTMNDQNLVLNTLSVQNEQLKRTEQELQRRQSWITLKRLVMRQRKRRLGEAIGRLQSAMKEVGSRGEENRLPVNSPVLPGKPGTFNREIFSQPTDFRLPDISNPRIITNGLLHPVAITSRLHANSISVQPTPVNLPRDSNPLLPDSFIPTDASHHVAVCNLPDMIPSNSADTKSVTLDVHFTTPRLSAFHPYKKGSG